MVSWFLLGLLWKGLAIWAQSFLLHSNTFVSNVSCLASPASSFVSLKFKIVTEGSCSSYECPNYQKVERERVLKVVLKWLVQKHCQAIVFI